MIIDVSQNNGDILWDKVKTNPEKISLVMVKATEGVGYNDKKCNFNAIKALADGYPVGYYHFASLNNTNVIKDATDEANYFMNQLKGLPKATVLALDIETNKINLPPDQVILFSKTFFNVLRVRMHEVGTPELWLYSGLSFINSEHLEQKDFQDIKLWLAEYNTKELPVMPKGWVKLAAWQYSCTGSVLGIKGNVDISKIIA